MGRIFDVWNGLEFLLKGSKYKIYSLLMMALNMWKKWCGNCWEDISKCYGGLKLNSAKINKDNSNWSKECKIRKQHRIIPGYETVVPRFIYSGSSLESKGGPKTKFYLVGTRRIDSNNWNTEWFISLKFNLFAQFDFLDIFQ